MTAPHIVDPAAVLDQALGQASPDLMRSLLQTVINALLSADADSVCGAQYGQASPERRAQLGGYRHRDPGTRVGRLTWLSPSCAPARTSPTGCQGAASQRPPHW